LPWTMRGPFHSLKPKSSDSMELDVVSSMGVTLSFFHGPPLPCPSTSKARLPCCFYCFATT
jgi:hypothetical protein